jgi:hypothetical protein
VCINPAPYPLAAVRIADWATAVEVHEVFTLATPGRVATARLTAAEPSANPNSTMDVKRTNLSPSAPGLSMPVAAWLKPAMTTGAFHGPAAADGVRIQHGPSGLTRRSGCWDKLAVCLVLAPRQGKA